MSEAFTLYKLIVLYMLEKLNFPLTNGQISEFILDKGYTNYFTLQQTLSEMVEANFIREETTHNRTLYHLTDEGNETIHYLNTLPISGIKLQLLHILKETDLAKHYIEQPFFLPNMEEYLELLSKLLCHLRPDIVVHRLTGDGPKSLLIAPLWTGNKRLVLNSMQKHFKDADIWQGKEYSCQKHLHSTN